MSNTIASLAASGRLRPYCFELNGIDVQAIARVQRSFGLWAVFVKCEDDQFMPVGLYKKAAMAYFVVGIIRNAERQLVPVAMIEDIEERAKEMMSEASRRKRNTK